MSIQSTADRLLALLGTALVAAAAAVLIFAGTGTGAGAGGDGGGGPAVATHTVVIKNYKFMPATVKVKAGTKLTFVDKDSSQHTATADASGGFDTNVLSQGEKKTITLSKPGTITYHCDLHPFMKGTIEVVG